jgi:hypothetical protein
MLLIDVELARLDGEGGEEGEEHKCALDGDGKAGRHERTLGVH